MNSQPFGQILNNSLQQNAFVFLKGIAKLPTICPKLMVVELK